MQEYIGASGGLGLIWDHRKVTLDILSTNNNWINGTINRLKSNLELILINVYGPTRNIENKMSLGRIKSIHEGA